MGKEAERPIRIVLVDDHAVVRTGLAALIGAETDLEVCGEAQDLDQARRVIDQTRPDIAVIDLSLGESSGLELIKRLADSPIATLVLSMHDDPLWAERALTAGARGYVHKSEATRRVVEAIRSVRNGDTWVSESISRRLVDRMVGSNSRGRATSPETTLSDRELEVFDRIGRGLSTSQIGEALGLSPKTVQTYRERIKEKLGLKTAAELATGATKWVHGS